MKKLTLLFAALVLSFTAQAAIINGTPKPGDKGRLNWWVNGVVESTPVTQPGDTIVLADGTYEEESVIDFTKAGLVVMAAEGAKPVIKTIGQWMVMNITATTTFEGITFDSESSEDNDKYAFKLSANAKFKNCTFQDYADACIQVDENVVVNSLVIEDCVFDGANTTPIAIYALGSIENCTIEGTEFKNFTEYAITAGDWCGGRIDKLAVDNCLFHDCVYSAICMPATTNSNTVQSCSDFELTNSTIYNVGNNPEGDEAPKRAVVEIRKNSFVASEQKVLIDHITIYNFPAPDYCGAFKVDQTNNTTISNCIAMNPDNIYKTWINPFVISAGATISNSVYFNCDYIDNGATQSNLVKADPMFVDAANADFMLYAESPAIGMGDPRWGVKAGLQPGEGKLEAAVEAAQPGDVIVLGDETYEVSSSIEFNKEGLTIVAAEGTSPIIKLTGEWTSLELSASTTFDGITFDGNNITKYPVTSTGTNASTYIFTNCEFKNYVTYAISNPYSGGTYAESVVIDNCLFHDGGAAVCFNKRGYNGNAACNSFKMTNTTIYNVTCSEWVGIIHIASNEEATDAQNEVIIDHITMYNFTPNELGGITSRFSENVSITNSIFANPTTNANQYAFRVYGASEVKNTLYHNARIEGTPTNPINADPLFVDATNGNFKLMPLSPARGAATDGSDLGDPRWYTPLTKYIVTATANPTEGGTVTGAGEYIEGVEVTLVATPAHGYNFVNWTKGEEVVAETAEYTFTASANVELVANFEEKAFTGNIINVEPGEGTLATAVENAEAGDKLVLADGTYELGYINGGLLLDKEGLTITAAENAKPVILYTDGGACLQVVASTTFEGITFDGGEETKASFLITTYGAEVEEIVVYNCEFKNYSNFAISDQWSKGCHIGSLKVDNCLFHDGGQAIVFSKNGFNSKHPCDYFEIKNSTVYNITHNEYKSVIHICSLGDATGAQNTVVIDHVTIWNYDLINGNAAIEVRKTNNLTITNCIIGNPETKKAATYLYGGSVSNIIHFNASLDSDSENTYCSNTDPLFVDAANNNFMLQLASPAIGKATDGSNLGDPRWGVAEPELITLTTGNNDAVIEANIGKTVNVKIERSFTANDGYYTLCVPFNMDPSVIGKAYSLGTITEHVAGEGINIILVEEEYMLSAGVPYLVLPKANMSELVVENVTIQSDIASGQNVYSKELNVNIFFEGFYSASGQTNGTTQYYVGNNGYLYNGEVEIRGLCGLFTITDKDGAPLKVRARVVTREEVETGLDNNQLPNINIQKVLENGQLIIIRDGVKYNVQGQVIK